MTCKEELPRRCRYEFFTIWGNGLPHVEEILAMLRAEESLDLLRLESLEIADMQEWVMRLYGCDAVPLEHLRGKLRYLWQAPARVLVVFALNRLPQEEYVGEGAFRHIQCMNINRIKWAVRDRFNPRYDGKRSEEHVIHASDYEEQTDYFLKMLGHESGVDFLHGDGDGLPFQKPYHIKRPARYSLTTTPIDALRARLLLVGDDGTEICARTVPISETPHYRSLAQGTDDYDRYLSAHRFTTLLDDHTSEKLLQMRNLTPDIVRRFGPILVRRDSEGTLCIVDGVHRAAAAVYHAVDRLQTVEFLP